MSFKDQKADDAARDLEYTVGYVAFLDVMGWRNLVAASVDDTSVFRRIAAAAIEAGTQLATIPATSAPPPWLGFTQFSDSIVLTADMTSGGPEVSDTFFYWLDVLYKKMLSRGLFMRGGLTFGQYFHKGSIAFGPAITHAYDLEEKKSPYMRIRVAVEVGYGETIDDFMRVIDLKQHSRFFDGLKVQAHNISPANRNQITKWQAKFLDEVRPFLLENLRRFERGDTKIYEKYAWFVLYFNEVAGECGAEPIAF